MADAHAARGMCAHLIKVFGEASNGGRLTPTASVVDSVRSDSWAPGLRTAGSPAALGVEQVHQPG
jgi:hypothetical protein